MDTQDSVCPIAQRKKTMHDYHMLFKLLTCSSSAEQGVCYYRWTPVACPEADFCIENKYVEVTGRTTDGIEFTVTTLGKALISKAFLYRTEPAERLSATLDWHSIPGMPVPPIERIIVQTLEAASSHDSGWYQVERESIAEKNVRYLGQHGYADWVCDSSMCRFRLTKKGILAWADATDLSDLPSFPSLIIRKAKQGNPGQKYFNQHMPAPTHAPLVPPFSHDLPKEEGSYWYQYKDCVPDLKDVLLGCSEYTEDGNPVPESKCLGYYRSCGEFIPLFVSEDERWSGPIPQPANTHAVGSLTGFPSFGIEE